jgi:hypothetical protein
MIFAKICESAKTILLVNPVDTYIIITKDSEKGAFVTLIRYP